MTVIGYGRVSTGDQNTEAQEAALRAAGCVRVFTDHASGAKADRPQLTAALDYLNPGDTVVVWRLDRLGRSLPHLVEVVRSLGDRHVEFRSLTEAIDTTTPSSDEAMPTAETSHLHAEFSGCPHLCWVGNRHAGLWCRPDVGGLFHRNRF